MRLYTEGKVVFLEFLYPRLGIDRTVNLITFYAAVSAAFVGYLTNATIIHRIQPHMNHQTYDAPFFTIVRTVLASLLSHWVELSLSMNRNRFS